MSAATMIARIDTLPTPGSMKGEFYVSPGSHAVEFYIVHGNDEVRKKTVPLQLDANHRYRFRCKISGISYVVDFLDVTQPEVPVRLKTFNVYRNSARDEVILPST